MSIRSKISNLNWDSIGECLDADGFALTEPLFSPAECESLAKLYDGPKSFFRSTIDMARYNFGSGQYRYFSYPLPTLVQEARDSFYSHLAAIANGWSTRLRMEVSWPDSLDEFLKTCHENDQTRPTPLLLCYKTGDYNCLHQDLYGDVYFPLQVVFMLGDSNTDFEGGELVLVENRPKMQSRASAVCLTQGCAAIIPVRERPRLGARGFHRAQMRHGVSSVRSGRRQTLGIIFHDAR